MQWSPRKDHVCTKLNVLYGTLIEHSRMYACFNFSTKPFIIDYVAVDVNTYHLVATLTRTSKERKTFATGLRAR